MIVCFTQYDKLQMILCDPRSDTVTRRSKRHREENKNHMLNIIFALSLAPSVRYLMNCNEYDFKAKAARNKGDNKRTSISNTPVHSSLL